MPEIIDPLGSAPGRPIIPTVLPFYAARRAFATAQALLAGSPVEPASLVDVGWHDSSVNAESGSFAVVGIGAGLDRLLGRIVQVSYRRRSVLVYVIATADVPVAFSLARRPFVALSVLSAESIRAMVAAT